MDRRLMLVNEMLRKGKKEKKGLRSPEKGKSDHHVSKKRKTEESRGQVFAKKKKFLLEGNPFCSTRERRTHDRRLVGSG